VQKRFDKGEKMESKIDVSIIIPAYNAENTIIECVNKILKIDRKRIEILIIDDGSKDKTNEICQKIEDKRVKIIRKQNGGVSSARNVGIANASGNYIMFCDADDYVQAEMMEHVIDKTKECDYDFVMYNIAKNDSGCLITEKLKLEQGEYGSEEGKLLEKFVLDVPLYKKWENNILQGSVWRYVYKRKFLQENNIIFDENIAYAEDLCFCVKTFERVKKFYVMNVVAYVVNIIPGTASRRFRIDFWETLQNVYDRITSITANENEILYCHYGRSAIIHYLMNQPFAQGMELCQNVLSNNRFIEDLKKIAFHKKTWEEKLMDEGCIKNSKIRLFIWSFYWKMYFKILKILMNVKKTIKHEYRSKE